MLSPRAASTPEPGKRGSRRWPRRRCPAAPRPALGDDRGAADHGAADHGAANHGAANHGAANHGTAHHRFGDRGASAIELVILAPALIFVSMLVVQFALWLDATHAALAAAQEGDRAARAAESSSPGWQQTATQVAMNYYHGLDTSVLGDVSVSRVRFDAATDTVSLTVSGRLTGIFPLTITETVSGPVECFRTAASQGTNCG